MGIFSGVFNKKNNTDPVCGMRAGNSINAVYQDKNYYFCSEHCKEEFLKEPDKFIK